MSSNRIVNLLESVSYYYVDVMDKVNMMNVVKLIDDKLYVDDEEFLRLYESNSQKSAN